MRLYKFLPSSSKSESKDTLLNSMFSILPSCLSSELATCVFFLYKTNDLAILRLSYFLRLCMSKDAPLVENSFS